MEQNLQGHSMIGHPPHCAHLAHGLQMRTFGLLLGFTIAAVNLQVPGTPAFQSPSSGTGISRAAAQSCDAKIRRMEAFDAAADKGKSLNTRLTEEELNSYLAIVLSPNYHPSLKSIQLKFDEGRLQGMARVDFDRLELGSNPLLSGLTRRMLSGIHELKVIGSLVSGSGKANFKLDEATFDGVALPNVLVTEIISAVGRKQNPPFDPMTPSPLPYSIQKVDVHSGFILVYQ